MVVCHFCFWEDKSNQKKAVKITRCYTCENANCSRSVDKSGPARWHKGCSEKAIAGQYCSDYCMNEDGAKLRMEKSEIDLFADYFAGLSVYNEGLKSGHRSTSSSTYRSGTEYSAGTSSRRSSSFSSSGPFYPYNAMVYGGCVLGDVEYEEEVYKGVKSPRRW